MMGLKYNLHQDKKPPISLFQGSISKILAREASLNQSSDSLNYRGSEGIPFKWETQPGTPKNDPRLDDDLIGTPPLSPSPLMQSLKLRSPNHMHDDVKGSSSKIQCFKEMVKRSTKKLMVWKMIRRRDHRKESFGFGENMDFSSCSHCSSSLSISFEESTGKGNVGDIPLQEDEENRGETPVIPVEGEVGSIFPLNINAKLHPPPGERDRDGSMIRGKKGSTSSRKIDEKEMSFREYDDSLRHYLSDQSPSESNANFVMIYKTKAAGYFGCASWKGIKGHGSCV